MSRTHLTAVQRAFLNRARIHTCSDDEGIGAYIFDGSQHRTAQSLRLRGFVNISMPHSGSAWGYAKITAAGRQALEAKGCHA